MISDPTIYKILPRAMWSAAQEKGRFGGAPVDLADGYIHFSTAAQVRETADQHFRGQDDLVLLGVDVAGLDRDGLKWEPSRGGDLFPHLYGELDTAAVRWAKPLPWNGETHDFPEELA